MRFYNFQAFIRVLRRVRNFVVISGTKESLRDGERSVLTVIDLSLTSWVSLVSRLEAGLSGTYTANTHPLSLVKTCRGSPLIGLIRFYK